MIYLETGSTNPYYNLAFEEYVFRHGTEDAYLILWQNDHTIVVGRNQNTEEEINCAYVEQTGVRIVRRMTGGGVVYHDMGNLNYALIIKSDENQTAITSRQFTKPVIQALQNLGLQAEQSGRNDILIEGRKVSGSAYIKQGTRYLHHGTLLLHSNLETVQKALCVDPEKFVSKGVKSVRERVENWKYSFQLKKDEFRLPIFMEIFWLPVK